MSSFSGLLTSAPDDDIINSLPDFLIEGTRLVILFSHYDSELRGTRTVLSEQTDELRSAMTQIAEFEKRTAEIEYVTGARDRLAERLTQIREDLDAERAARVRDVSSFSGKLADVEEDSAGLRKELADAHEYIATLEKWGSELERRLEQCQGSPESRT
jgi:chromosome segregation ATPase